MQQKTTLGKGLASLFPNVPPGIPTAIPARPKDLSAETKDTKNSDAGGTAEKNSKDQSGAASAGSENTVSRDRIPGITMVVTDEIQINPFQPRREFNEAALEELAESIRSNGIIQPLVVRRVDKGYQLIAGERRLRAAKRVGLLQVPVVVRRSTDKESLEVALIENIQRQDLNCVDTALAYFQLLNEFSLTQEELAKRVGKDRATVANHLRLLKLPDEVLVLLKSAALSFGHGKALLSLEQPEQQRKMAEIVVRESLSVRELESRVEAMKRGSSSGQATSSQSAPQTPIAKRFDALSQELGRTWSTRIELKGSERRGKIVIHYATRQELDRIIGRMQN